MSNEKNANLHKGHRRRMMDKYIKNGINVFEEHEMLEVLLFMAYSRKNTNELAHMLLNRFGSMDKVLNAPLNEITEIDGIGENTALFLRFVRNFIIWYSKNVEIPEKLDSFKKIQDYCIRLFKFINAEEIHAVFLDLNNNFIKEYCVGNGDFSKENLNISDFISLAIGTKCERLVLTHYHQNSSPIPSQSDISETLSLQSTFSIFDIELADHIIVGANGSAYSMKSYGVID